ncbi:MAG: hypothetical protein KJ970_15765 [Candidatus Eisenbacteria bacterium]|uniref:Uncharacterized protein n=1 Tax=Eiseniibacteriota bacterium TaxID=2212470 RepID=A0A948W7L7_UNCEI|nr:hypothetical protein [Candidatus Eisenbacteria bacterium]
MIGLTYLGIFMRDGKYAILLDGGFVIKKFQSQSGKFPIAEDVVKFCSGIRENPRLRDLQLLRIYFYHALPSTETLVNPIDGRSINFSTTTLYRESRRLLDTLELEDSAGLAETGC